MVQLAAAGATQNVTHREVVSAVIGTAGMPSTSSPDLRQARQPGLRTHEHRALPHRSSSAVMTLLGRPMFSVLKTWSWLSWKRSRPFRVPIQTIAPSASSAVMSSLGNPFSLVRLKNVAPVQMLSPVRVPNHVRFCPSAVMA